VKKALQEAERKAAAEKAAAAATDGADPKETKS